MSELVRISPRNPDRRRPATRHHGHDFELIDISARHAFNLSAVPDIAADFARLPAARDREAAVAQLIRDFCRTAKARHGVDGPQLNGAAIAVEARLRRQIREIMERKRE